MQKTAVVLFNLGGPDGPAAIRPFLFNLFNDPAIIGAPAPLRWLLAKWISGRRAPVTAKIYQRMNGASPLLPNTEIQARALKRRLGKGYRVFIAMRYWHPFSEETAAEVRAWDAARVVLVPLYPQFSTTTTGSSLAAWRRAAAGIGLDLPTTAICCYPREQGFVAEMAKLIRPRLARAAKSGRPPPRLLLTAHGLPKKIIARGDPYQWQVERCAEAIVLELGLETLDWTVCYQSRVGPLEWIGPATDEEIRRAGRDGVPVVVAPIAFVSEHSETLVELDIDYATLAKASGVPDYLRVPTVGTAPGFIDGLAKQVAASLAGPGELIGEGGCPASCHRCPIAVAGGR